MRLLSNISLITLLFINAMSCKSNKNSNSPEQSVPVEMTIMFTSAYCGGAYPPEELLEQLKKPKPLTSKEIFYVKKGDSFDNAIKIKTNENGQIELELVSGEYNLFFPEKLTSTPSRPLFEKVCETWKNIPNGNFKVSREESKLFVTVVKTCNGCYDPAA